jgi:regulator of sigma E protease
MWTLIVAILGLGLLIVVHEAGHYVVARLTGMRVERFSIGFGPGIIKWRHKETLFQIAPIPFGGFVQIVGMNPHEEYDEKDPSVYPNRPALFRFLTIFAGPATNVISACVLIFFVFAIAGMPRESGRGVISKVVEGMPAAEVMKPGDIVTKVEGAPVTLESFRTRVMESGGRPLEVTVLREGREETLTLTARKSDSGVYQVGVNLGHEIERQDIGLGTAAVESVRYTYLKAKLILVNLWEVAKKPSDAEVMGPVGITDEINKQFRAGWVTGLEILALLNIYLGLFNLLPLPALDGSRLAFLVYEIATRRRPNPKVETAVHMAGTVVLLVVMVLVLFKDIKKVVG